MTLIGVHHNGTLLIKHVLLHTKGTILFKAQVKPKWDIILIMSQ